MYGSKKIFVGDGVYVAHDGFGIVLTAEGYQATNSIYLEPDVWDSLKLLVAAMEVQLEAELKAKQKEAKERRIQ